MPRKVLGTLGDTPAEGLGTRKKRQFYDILNDPGARLEYNDGDFQEGAMDEVYNTRRRGRPKKRYGQAAMQAARAYTSATQSSSQSFGRRSNEPGQRADQFIFKIESVLFRKTMPHAQWREFLSAPKHQSNTVKRGSVWVVPDSIWYDDSKSARTKPVTRYLIKWKDHSFLHCSWELPVDLSNTSICEVATFGSDKGYAKRRGDELLAEIDRIVHAGQRLFPDLRKIEYYPP